MRRAALVFVLLGGIVLAQVVVEKQVVDNGGGFKEGAGLRSYASIGQAVAGIGSNASYTSQAGYITWLGIELEVKPQPCSSLPERAQIGLPFPNPFNSACQINVVLPEPEDVAFTVYDLGGRVIFSRTVRCKAGAYTLRFDAGKLPSGVYLYTVSAGDVSERGKLMLVR